MKTPTKKNNQITGNIGLFYASFQLSKLGWNVLPTSRNAAAIDIVVYNQSATKTFTIQMKTVSKSVAIPLGNNLEKLVGDFLIICSNAELDFPEVYIYTIDQAKELCKPCNNKDGSTSYWIDKKDYRKEENRNNWTLIGSGID